MQTERPVRGTRYEDDFVRWAERNIDSAAIGLPTWNNILGEMLVHISEPPVVLLLNYVS